MHHTIVIYMINLMAAIPPAGDLFPYTHFRRLPLFPGQVRVQQACCMRIDRQGHYYLVDIKGGKVYVLDADGKPRLTLGRRIGEGLYLDAPGGVAIDGEGRIYVEDDNQMKIYVFDKMGKYLWAIPIGLRDSSVVLEVDSRGRLWRNAPRRGKLLTAYTPQGQVITEFGDLMTLEKAYPGKGKDERYRVPLSRAWVALDEEDALYVAFIFVPILQKYDASGRLLWERRLEGPEVEALVRGFWGEAPREGTYWKVWNIDGVQMRVIINGMAYDKKNRRVYLLLGNNDIYVYSADGTKVSALREWKPPGERKYMLSNITADSQGNVYGTSWDKEGFFRLEFFRGGGP